MKANLWISREARFSVMIYIKVTSILETASGPSRLSCPLVTYLAKSLARNCLMYAWELARQRSVEKAVRKDRLEPHR